MSLQVFVAVTLCGQNGIPKVAYVDSREVIETGLKSHDRALFIHNDWIRDPYIILRPDDYCYLTGTTTNPGDTAILSDPYNKGLFKGSLIGGRSAYILQPIQGKIAVGTIVIHVTWSCCHG
ncbi:MAG: hypothetical protein AAFP89_06775 [Bacteroidota bacterium]